MKTLNLDKMKLEGQNLKNPQNTQLNIPAVSGSLLVTELEEFFMRWVRIGIYGMKKKKVNIQYKGHLMQ